MTPSGPPRPAGSGRPAVGSPGEAGEDEGRRLGRLADERGHDHSRCSGHTLPLPLNSSHPNLNPAPSPHTQCPRWMQTGLSRSQGVIDVRAEILGHRS